MKNKSLIYGAISTMLVLALAIGVNINSEKTGAVVYASAATSDGIVKTFTYEDKEFFTLVEECIRVSDDVDYDTTKVPHYTIKINKKDNTDKNIIPIFISIWIEDNGVYFYSEDSGLSVKLLTIDKAEKLLEMLIK